MLARVGAAISLLPGLGEAAPPAMVRAAIALALTLLLLPSLLPLMPASPEAGSGLALMVVAEAVTGLWFGWLARILAQALPLAGQYIAYFLGLASVLQTDPELGSETTALARLGEVAMPLIILGSGLYTLPLEALSGLYHLIPPGAGLPFGDGAEITVMTMGKTFVLALRLASPFVVACIVWHVAMGLAARLVPRLQIYFVAAPGQILGGLLLFASLAGVLLRVWADAMRIDFAALPGAG